MLATKVETLVDDGDEQNILNTPSVGPIDLPQPSGATTLILTVGPSPSTPQPENIPMKANFGDLDWSYTSRCVRRWSPSSLLAHLYSHAFSVPPSDGVPSSPFVFINPFSQDGDDPEIVSLPQAYRLPLLMVAKYLWGTLLLALSVGREEWLTQKANIFHISRLCENLFASARIKASKGGMEREWRCLMFDRFLSRFFNHWTQNDPASNETFWKEHGVKEYDKDVLVHDWARWSLRGLNGIRLTEQQISWGLTADQFRRTLIPNRESYSWTLEGKTLSFITSDEGPAWSSVSDLTDVDFGEDDEELKPSLDVIGSIFPASAPPKEPREAFATRGGDSGSSARRLRFAHHSSSVRLLPKRVPDQARLSTLRKSARTASALPSIPGPNSAIASLPGTGPSQIHTSSQTSIRPSSRNNHSRLVVLIKRPAQVAQTEGSVQSSIRNTNAERSNFASNSTDLIHPDSPSNLLKRVSRPSLKKKEMEGDAARREKRRRMDFENGIDGTTVQASTHQAPRSSIKDLELNGVPYNLDTQRTNPMRVEVAAETTPTAIAIDKGTQTDDRDVVICDSTRIPTTTMAKKTTTDVAIQAGLSPLNNSLKGHQKGNSTIDGCTKEMHNNLSLVVDNLVSSSLISVMRALKQSSEPAPASESGTSGSSSTVCQSSAPPSKRISSSDIVNGLFDEVRSLREEAHVREQRAREEMRALRHLHNVEVDSLRKRLAYLECQSHEQVVKGCDTWRAAGEPSYRAGWTHYNNGNTITMPPRLRDKHHCFPDDDIPSSSFVPSLRSPDPPVPGPFSNGNGFSGRLVSTTRSQNDMEDSPLPSKAQRKSHIIGFSRPSAVG